MNMATSDEDIQRAVDAEIKAKLAAQQEGPVASPSVPFTKYILEDTDIPEVHPSLKRAVYDKEIPLGNLNEIERRRLGLSYQRAEIALKNSRPLFAGGNDEEIIYSTLPGKICVKLSRADGGFQTKQLTTMTTIRRIETPLIASSPKKSRWRFLGRGGEK